MGDDEKLLLLAMLALFVAHVSNHALGSKLQLAIQIVELNIRKMDAQAELCHLVIKRAKTAADFIRIGELQNLIPNFDPQIVNLRNDLGAVNKSIVW